MTAKGPTAVWAVTPTGARLGARISRGCPDSRLYVPPDLSPLPGLPDGAVCFEELREAVADAFRRYRAHVFVMAAGIAVRMIAPHIRSKKQDPAVLAVDDTGGFVVSLLSGHMGGANALARAVAREIGAVPVITTATDSAGVPAVDLLAGRHDLEIENIGAVRKVSMAFLRGGRVWRHDPYHILDPELDGWTRGAGTADFESGPGIYLDHQLRDMPGDVLVLRPKTLAAGVGCNRGTPDTELIACVNRVLEAFALSPASLGCFGTISDKLAEPGIAAMARHFGKTLKGFDRRDLAGVTGIVSPSEMVNRHMGVFSVCEAAAILGAGKGSLVVPKQKSSNVTVAVAAVPSILSG